MTIDIFKAPSSDKFFYSENVRFFKMFFVLDVTKWVELPSLTVSFQKFCTLDRL